MYSFLSLVNEWQHKHVRCQCATFKPTYCCIKSSFRSPFSSFKNSLYEGRSLWLSLQCRKQGKYNWEGKTIQLQVISKYQMLFNHPSIHNFEVLSLLLQYIFFYILIIICFSSIPNSSDEFAPNFYLDDIYDGKLNEATNRLEGGLGVLTDGLYGSRVILSDQRMKPGIINLKLCLFSERNKCFILIPYNFEMLNILIIFPFLST